MINNLFFSFFARESAEINKTEKRIAKYEKRIA